MGWRELPVALFRRHALGAVAFLSLTRLSVRSDQLLIFKTAPPSSSADFHRLRLVQFDVNQTFMDCFTWLRNGFEERPSLYGSAAVIIW